MYRVYFDIKPQPAPAKMEAECDRVEKSLVKHAFEKVGTDDDFKARQYVLGFFHRNDRKNVGYVDEATFAKVLKELNIVLSCDAVRTFWFDLYDIEGDSRFMYYKFADALFGKLKLPQKIPSCRQVIDQVRAKILERGLSEMRGLTRCFRMMDTNSNQKLSKEEFRIGLKHYGLEFPDDLFEGCYRGFDRNGDGISVTEFLSTIRGPLNERRKTLVGLAYKQLDKDGSGVVEFREIKSIYDATRHPEVVAKRKTVDDVLMEFIQSWDRDGDGTITLLEFIDYYKDISCSIDNDDYFELMIRNAWHLAGGKGWCANTSNLRVLVIHSDDSQEVVGINNDLGLDKDDDDALRAALEEQGVKDIKKIELAH